MNKKICCILLLSCIIIVGSLNSAQTFGCCLPCATCTSCCGTCNTRGSCGCPCSCCAGNDCAGSYCCNCTDCSGCSSCNNCECCCRDCCFCEFGKTWFSQRDQGSNEYLTMSQTADKRHIFGDEFYGDFSLALGWQQNFNRYRLSSYFFNKNGLMSVGANAANGTTAMVDVRASDLGLSSTFTGTAWLCPKYHDLIADIDIFMGWDNVTEGLWTELRIPIVHTKWNAGLGTSVDYEGGTNYAVPYAIGSQVAANQNTYIYNQDGNVAPVEFTGRCALSSALLGNVCFGGASDETMNAPRLTAGKIINCSRTNWGLSGIRLTIGYDFLRRERGYLGFAFDVEFPVANKPCEKTCCSDLYTFEPKIGSQHRWLVGGVLFGRYKLWQINENERVDFNFDARAYGAFNGRTTRMLGLWANGTTLFNHYLLLEKYEVNGITGTYRGLERAANLLKSYVKSKPLGEGQFTAMVSYQRNNFVCGLGYNFYGRQHEQLCLCQRCLCADYYYVIKGDAPVASADGSHHGGFYNPNDSNINTTGTLVSNSQATWGSLAAATITNNAIDWSLGNGNLRLCVAEHPQYISNTIFANIGYNWSDADWKPYLSLIGKVDLGMDNTALRLWGLYLKGGFCF